MVSCKIKVVGSSEDTYGRYLCIWIDKKFSKYLGGGTFDVEPDYREVIFREFTREFPIDLSPGRHYVVVAIVNPPCEPEYIWNVRVEVYVEGSLLTSKEGKLCDFKTLEIEFEIPTPPTKPTAPTKLEISCSVDKIELKPNDKVRVSFSWSTDQPLVKDDILTIYVVLHVEGHCVKTLAYRRYSVSKGSSSGGDIIEVTILDLKLSEGIYNAEIKVYGTLINHRLTDTCVVKELRYIQPPPTKPTPPPKPRLKTEIRLEKTKIVKGEKIETIVRIERM